MHDLPFANMLIWCSLKSYVQLCHLVAPSSLQEAIECVRDLQSPTMLHVFVREGINHSLEKSATARECLGKLFLEMVREQLLSHEKFVEG